MRRSAFLAFSLILAFGVSGCESCTTRTGPRDGEIPGLDAGPPIPGVDAGPPGRFDAGNFDPFDPANGCGSSAIPTERVPGQLLLVFDRSGSMNRTPGGDEPSAGDPSKWDVSRAAINSVLSSVSDELSMGLVLFPPGNGCDIATSPDVPVAPLSTSRSQIMGALNSSSAGSSETPMFSALAAGYDYLDTLSGPGQRGIVLVTDGAETCEESNRDMFMMRVADERAMNNYLTYAVGLSQNNNDLSTIAYNGGTPRTDTCLPECTSDLCTSNADCPGAGTCDEIFAGSGIRFCSCMSDADCVAPQTCPAGSPIPLPIPIPRLCQGDANCCHYNASEGNFQTEFEAALADIASRFLDSCVFELPRGTDPSSFDPTQVNVGVTFDGEMRRVLGRSSMPDVDSWDFTSPDQTSIIIQGPICDQLLMGSATVEIVLGCPTILI